uniref:Transcriptional regulator n=1 Tax=Anisakis simplex TaxID=6269 RepID=A0A0M3JIX7_ANISI
LLDQQQNQNQPGNEGEDHADCSSQQPSVANAAQDARHKKTKRKIVIEVLRVANDEITQQPSGKFAIIGLG